jgi:hypothetical protein
MLAEDTERVSQSGQALLSEAQRYLDEFERIDFPSRLGRVDSPLSAMGANLSNLVSEVSSIDRRLERVVNEIAEIRKGGWRTTILVVVGACAALGALVTVIAAVP